MYWLNENSRKFLAKVIDHLEAKNTNGNYTPSVEGIQDVVEIWLMRSGLFAM